MEMLIIQPSYILVIPLALLLLTIHKALNLCASQNRLISPAKIWLIFIPIWGIYWQFYVVRKVSDSFAKELEYRKTSQKNTQNIVNAPGKGFGIVACLMTSPLNLGLIIGLLIGLICWVIYWIKVAQFSSYLKNEILKDENANPLTTEGKAV
ncbi:MAG: hypothetical protein JXA91_04495 [Candidatus Thermoplasmatota archaeon]|nr:hypothetical protein [Candidatus Thermoplasmatota archaeon]